MNNARSSTSNYSIALVMLQLGAIAVLIIPLSDYLAPEGPLSWIGIAVSVSALVLGLWAIRSMHGDTISPFPEPRGGASMVATGPYRFVRHPMYSAVLLAGCGAVLVHRTTWHAAVMLVLIVVLLLKIRREESLLREHYEDYSAYASRTARLIPGVW